VSQVQIITQGPLRAVADGVEVELGPLRQQAVFAVLFFNADRVVTSSSILHGVWGTDAPATGRKVVPPYIYRLRRAFDGAVPDGGALSIDTLRRGYRLQKLSVSIDIERFEAALNRAEAAETAGKVERAAGLLAAAAEGWADEPLAGLPGPFAEVHRRRLAERRMVAMERWLSLEIRLGRHHRAIPPLLALRAEQPLRERVAVLLMAALYQVGRQAEALEVFGQVRQSLARELGLSPGGELTGAYQAILRAAEGHQSWLTDGCMRLVRP
jgi:DNA-binding SARP family transcriptional activator